ncbi:hypothetical protein CMUC_0424 [Campylobacter mucosalis CCUG 21559]|uniref:Uncharacterized protein n=1 Tax=Campylobacter mucosalis CCUG 21559 TaxID=1032067 RepID=A0A6G5QF93_9BACT|nr:hypothetical protein CMUC_0424 [Campylobacter mucosalis CCUG 21559]
MSNPFLNISKNFAILSTKSLKKYNCLKYDILKFYISFFNLIFNKIIFGQIKKPSINSALAQKANLKRYLIHIYF